MASNHKDVIYSQDGSFMHFLTQTDQKIVSLQYILDKLTTAFDLRKYKTFTFTDIGAGTGFMTLKIMDFLSEGVKLNTYCIEPSELASQLEEKLGDRAHIIKAKAESTELPKSDFVLMAHVGDYIKDRKAFSQRLYAALNPGALLLGIGTHSESKDILFRRALRKKPKEQDDKGDLYALLVEQGGKMKREYRNASIDLRTTKTDNPTGNALIEFYYHIPFSDLSPQDIEHFHAMAKQYAPRGILKKKLRFTWIEKPQ